MKLATIRTGYGTTVARVDGDTLVAVHGYPSLDRLLAESSWAAIAGPADAACMTTPSTSVRRRRSRAWSTSSGLAVQPHRAGAQLTSKWPWIRWVRASMNDGPPRRRGHGGSLS